MKTIRLKDAPFTKWSGGKTWQLWIFPEGSSLANRDFDFRISSASIETESSTFTPMSGYLRYLTVLTEPIKISINGEEQLVNPLEIVSFSGSDTVISRGKTQDLNLIYRAGIEAVMQKVSGQVLGPCLVFNPKKMALVQLAKEEKIDIENGIKCEIRTWPGI